MSLSKVISHIRAPTLTDAAGNCEAASLPDSGEHSTIGPVAVVEKSASAALVHPRPTLPNRIAIVGNYLPRRCGIATFTTDLCDAIHSEYASTELLALPVNDTQEGYDYPDRIRFELAQDEIASYRQAADFLNFSNVDLVCLQHEYGIFGGDAGAHILELLRHLQAPVRRKRSAVER